MDGMTRVDWGEELDAENLLEAAAAAPATAQAADLGDLAARLAAIASTIDVERARASVTNETPRGVLAGDEGAPLMALRWYQPGEVSTVHRHAWTILVGLSGDGTVERWVESGGRAELRTATSMNAGSIVCLGDGEVHRQRSGDAGSLELVLIADWSDARPRVDLDPTDASQRTATLLRDWMAAYQQADADAVGALCTDDVLLDANVPHWRFQSAGREALVDGLRMSEFAPGYRLTERRGRPTADGAVVEIEARFEHEGQEHLSRQVHVLRCDEAGRVAEVTLYCTGIWNAETIERQRLYAPMVRP